MNKKQYTIEEICSLTGMTRRNIRYYVQIGLIDPPAGRGRGGFYNDSHLDKLRQIKSLQSKGMNLASITEYLKHGSADTDKVSLREVWSKYEIAPGIEISIRGDIEDIHRRKVSQIIQVARAIAKEDSSDE
ncbi:MAG: MerR family transcriptional regulator [Nitrospirae bacterium]|nr:MAG: MerR family transcriptional regulator [Nitrospirota bacterium]